MRTLNLFELNLKSSYESGIDDLVQDFYLPVLECAISYDRIAGFFSSSSLAIASRGIGGLIKNGGRIRLLASPKLSKKDADMIESVTNDPDKFVSHSLLFEVTHIESEFERDHVKALGWMLANGFLQIKLVKVVNGKNGLDPLAIFHQKIGIVKDAKKDILSFSGSINETASAWLHNIEEFKVFQGWKIGQDDFVKSDIDKFESFWCGARFNVKTFDLPEAVHNKLLEYSKDFSVEEFCTKYYIENKKRVLLDGKGKYIISTKGVDENLSLFFYQAEAVDMWVNNGYRLLFEMATGTGKTRTAIACVNKLLQEVDRLVVIVACPQSTLARQWQTEVDGLGLVFDGVVIADGNNHNWRNQLVTGLKKLSIGFNKNLMIYTTHITASKKDFVEIIQKNSLENNFCFIGDEAHGLGALKNKHALLSIYKYRIGLSATPKRWFDDVGTEILTNYFGGNSFEFPIFKALTTINPLTNRPFLVNYYYHPVFVDLTEDELEAYRKLSLKIRKLALYKKSNDEYQKKYESLLFARANIEKNAENKLLALQEVLDSEKNVKNVLLFVSDQQIDMVLKILKDNDIFAHRFTQTQGTIPKKQFGGLTERQYLIKNFKEGTYQVLVAISCLDEGIDIPSAETAILMASSTNPREYIQRIGRVIRQAPNKGQAHIFDFIIEPTWDQLYDPELIQFEKKIFSKELCRVSDMAENALNNVDVQIAIDKRLRRLDRYGTK